MADHKKYLWKNGQQVFLVLSDFGSVNVYWDKESALDGMTRLDHLYSFVVTEMVEVGK